MGVVPPKPRRKKNGDDQQRHQPVWFARTINSTPVAELAKAALASRRPGKRWSPRRQRNFEAELATPAMVKPSAASVRVKPASVLGASVASSHEPVA